MMGNQQGNGNRRDFLKTMIRTGVAGGLVSLGWVLGKRRRSNGESCPEEFICQSCKQKNTCTLPEAVAERNKTTGLTHD